MNATPLPVRAPPARHALLSSTIMSLLGMLLSPFRSLLGSSIRAVFEGEVRQSPVIVNADTQSDDQTGFKERSYGFAPQYVVPLRRPKTDTEAQRLYNHIRTTSWYLDAIPLLGRRLPFNIGIDSIIGVIPGVGDYIGLLLSLYALMLSALFGLPLSLLAMMMVNIVVDTFIGLIPIVGDALDVAFKANLRNLRLLEDHLIETKGSCKAGQFYLVFPPSNAFLPSDSPQRQAPMPNLAVPEHQARTRGADGGWASTTSAPPPRRFTAQDFRSGAMERVQGREVRTTPASETTIVPNEVFTTMRYEARGMSIREMCAALPPHLAALLDDDDEAPRIPLLPRHLDRLDASVKAMSRAFPREWGACGPLKQHSVTQAIDCELETAAHNGSSRRIRVSVDQRGGVHVSTFAMATGASGAATSPPPPPQTVRLDSQSTVDDRFALALYQHKTGCRDMYDAARARVNATLGMPSTSGARPHLPCFDVLMWHDGQLTESSIANVLLYSHASGHAYTPPASKLPLLPGIMRQELLSRRIIQERPLALDTVQADVAAGRATLYLCNALRGIIAVSL